MTVTRIEKLEVGAPCFFPRFSPGGERVYFTGDDYKGIWEFTIATGKTRLITDDPGSGYGFVVGRNSIAYRRTLLNEKRERKQEIVLKDLSNGTSTTIASGADISIPVLSGTSVVYSIGTKTNTSAAAPADAVVLGIEDTKIALVRNGTKTVLDPLGNGSYIWPSLDADKLKLLACEMQHGAFTCTLDGTVTSRLGRRNAPRWTRDGRWIVYMDDRDDGYRTISSDLYCVTPDGKTTIRLTDTPDVIELYPDCSPAENRIVYCSQRGELYLMTYEVKE